MGALSKPQTRRLRRARRLEIAASRDLEADGRALAGHALDLVASLGLSPGATVLCYESMPAEPPTTALNARLVAAGLRVLVPDTLPDLDLDWHDVSGDGTRLGLDAVRTAALVLAPGLAVDRSGTRMGQGGGCYDRALTRRAPGVRAVVLLHPGELLDPGAEPLPVEPHDVRVDGVLTADGLVDLPAG